MFVKNTLIIVVFPPRSFTARYNGNEDSIINNTIVNIRTNAVSTTIYCSKAYSFIYFIILCYNNFLNEPSNLISMEKIFFVTGNQHKYNEAKALLKEFDVEQIKIDLPELQGKPEEVAEEKAKLAYEKIKKPVFVDDTGLALDALNGMPGIYVKHFLDAIGCDGIRELTKKYNNDGAEAFVTIGYCDGKQTKVFVGRLKGNIVDYKSKGHGHVFGWDPIFQPEGLTETFSSLDPEEKNKISHRMKALNMFHEFLTN